MKGFDIIFYFFCSLFVVLAGGSVPLLGSASSPTWETHVELVKQKLPSLPGWCSKEKAEVLMNFIHRTKPKVCVEIGSFGGSTTYPIASALSFSNEGVLYAIDAWDNQAAIDGLAVNDPNIEWWSSLDMDAIYHQFIISMKPLNKWHRVIRQPSVDAVDQFLDESIDFLYIDGNFSVLGSFLDAVLYYPKVKKGGYIWVNDADNHYKHHAVIFLMESSNWIKEESVKNKCIVFQKPN